MNEGKPTTPKWWNRGGRQAPAYQPETASPDSTTTAGEPADAWVSEAAERAAGSGSDPDSDASSDGGAVQARGGDADGDFPLPRPTRGGGPAGAVSGGDVGPERSAGGGHAGGGDGASPDGDFAFPDGDFALRLPQDAAGAKGGHGGTDGSRSTAQPPLAGERPKPLHDPDPYSTPPYGEPGPWAPAPPVQHPAATPAQGTTIPAPPAPQTAQHAAPHPASGAPAPLPVPGARTPTGAALPGSPPPSPVHGAPEAPAPAPDAPAPTAAHGAPAAPHGAPPAPVPTAAQGLPAPAAAAHGAPAAPHGAPAAPHGAPAPTPPPPSTPWQNYDPWSPLPSPLPAPLQQTGAAVEGEGRRRGRVRRGLVAGAVVLAVVSGGVGGVVGAYLERNGGVGAVELPQAGKEPRGRAPDSVAGIAARALPSVVTLHVTGAEESGTGTGFVLDDLGHILTNNHVVQPAGSSGEISVTFNSGDTAKATVVGRDSGYDLAVVKVSGVRGLRPMPLGNSDNVQVGDPVVAIGAPFDLEGTVTSGIISAKERPITAGGDGADGSDVSYVDALQTDAPINPGNSGGPLLDSQARVIGINSAIRSADDGSDSAGGQAGSIGLGFAIPVNQAKRVAEELINNGKAAHPVIGVTLDLGYTGDGARVGTKAAGGGPAVSKGGPGAEAGIKAGDIITAIDGRPVHSGEELIVRTRAHRPGDRLELTVERDGRERRISLVLGSSDGGR